ncbi:MAG: ABC transporter permease subunit [Leptospirales bacterium]
MQAEGRRNFGILFLFLTLLVFVLWLLFQHPAKFQGGPFEQVDLSMLPGDLGRSLLRLFAAYFLSLTFAYVYGLLTALTRWGERYLLPLLDILQSIPVLGFFPAVIFLLLRFFRDPLDGVELASVILIATSMAWNMAFAVFESIRTAPLEYQELLTGLQAPWWIRLTTFLIPITIPKMVYNSILSWAQGWYFLIACEMISMGSIHYRLNGLGSFLVVSTTSGQLTDALMGILLLVLSVILMDILLFRPIMVWSQRFQIEQSSSPAGQPHSSVRDFLLDSEMFEGVRILVGGMRSSLLRWLYEILRTPSPRALPKKRSPSISLLLEQVPLFLGLLLGGWVVFLGARGILHAFQKGIPWNMLSELPADLLFSMLRLLAGYILSLLWTVPLAYWVFRSPRLARYVMPVAQVMASVPATALFPFIIVLVVRTMHSMDLASILLLLSGMQWYLLFNLLAGVGTFPNELREVSMTLGVKGGTFIRKIFLPFLYPSLVTGSITAFGGGWNALIVSEYVVYDQKNYAVRGIGAFLDRATYGSGNEVLIVASLLLMTVVVVTLNRFFWTPLYERVTSRYGFNG